MSIRSLFNSFLQVPGSSIEQDNTVQGEYNGGEYFGSALIGGTLKSTNWGTTAGSYFDLDNATVTLGGSTSPKLYFDGTNLTIAGAISASTIDIGGADATSFHVDIDGNMWSGNAAFASGPFRVSNAGALTASNATVTGAITASSGTIQDSVLIGSSGIAASSVKGWAHGSDSTKIDGGDIYTNTVTASKITVSLSGNLVKNSSFEAWSTASLPTAWTAYAGATKISRVEPTVSVHGTYAVKFAGDGTTATIGVQQPMNKVIGADKYYIFSFWIIQSTSTTDGTYNVDFYGTGVNTTGCTGNLGDIDDGAWHKITSAPFTLASIPSDLVMRVLVTDTPTNGKNTYIDGIMLQECLSTTTETANYAPEGITVIDGSVITTGKIQNGAGTVYFDLDNSKIYSSTTAGIEIGGAGGLTVASGGSLRTLNGGDIYLYAKAGTAQCAQFIWRTTSDGTPDSGAVDSDCYLFYNSSLELFHIFTDYTIMLSGAVVSLNGTLIEAKGDLEPNVDSMHDLGDASFAWDALYVNHIIAHDNIESQTGVVVGASSENNHLDDGSNGTGSATLYIGNKTIDTSVSDERKKDFIGKTKQADDILKLRVQDYTYKSTYDSDSVTKHIGVSAQETYKINPAFVIKPKDESGLWKINHQDVLFACVAKIQELSALIDKK